MEQVNREIGKRVRQARKARDLTLEQAARRLGRGVSTLAKYETGQIAMDVAILYELAEVFQIHVEQLLYLPPKRLQEEVAEVRPAFSAACPNFTPICLTGAAASCCAASLTCWPGRAPTATG